MASVRLSVGDFVALTNQTLEYAYPSVEVVGEVQSFKVNQGKYVFFDLKDAEGSVGCFMTVWQLKKPIEDGMKIIVTASPKLTNWGKFSLTVRSVEPVGEGSIKRSFDLLRAKLEKEGLFEATRKRPLPVLPENVAVISSVQAAGYADFIKILGERWGGIKVQVAQVTVQGETAPGQIMRALDYYNQLETPPEVIIILRGGGSADDLAAFNDESLVRAVAASRAPTLAAIGHETDVSLVDMVADVRAATPSNAAQILVPDRREIISRLSLRREHVLNGIMRATEEMQQSLDNKTEIILGAFSRRTEHLEQKFHYLRGTLKQVDPQTVLRRGYAIIRGEQVVGEEILVETKDIIMKAEVKNVARKK